METKDWIFLAVQIVGLWLVWRQNRIQSAQVGRPSMAVPMFRRYWPMAVMVILLGATWIPYLLSSRSVLTVLEEPPVGITAWGFAMPAGAPVPTGIFSLVAPTKFAPKYQDKFNVVLIVRVEENTVDASIDEVIDKSNPFQIAARQIDVSFGPKSIARLDRQRLISIYLTVLPKNAQLSEISTLNSVTTHGGFILSLSAVGFHPGQ